MLEDLTAPPMRFHTAQHGIWYIAAPHGHPLVPSFIHVLICAFRKRRFRTCDGPDIGEVLEIVRNRRDCILNIANKLLWKNDS